MSKQENTSLFKQTLPLLLLILTMLICILFFNISCTHPMVLVVHKEPTGVLDNCTYSVDPINKRAGRIGFEDGILCGCNDYKLFDTIIITRKTFTNW